MKVVDAPYVQGFKDKRKEKIVKKIRHKRKVDKVYVVTLPLITDGIMDIYEYKHLFSKFYKKASDEIYILGIAKSKKDYTKIFQHTLIRIYHNHKYFFV